MVKACQSVTKADYYKCNLHYIKKFFSIREMILVSVLLILAVVMFALFKNLFIIVMFAITAALILFAFGLYWFTAVAAYKQEYEKRSISKQKFYFNELGFLVENYNGDEMVYKENHTFEKIEKVAIMKDRVYLYTGVAQMFYITDASITEGDFDGLQAFLKKSIAPAKFKMKTRIRQFPGYSVRQQRKENSETGGNEDGRK